MCGITGYVGHHDSLPIIASSLKNLEYRGYDSAGIALQNGDIEIYKRAGEIDDLTPKLPQSTSATTGIGHTRWSTHGKPSDQNAHPHADCTGTIAVVHNGIIDNYAQLKAELEADHTFVSETDTEVIPHLIEEALESGLDLPEAVSTALERLDGSFAVAVTAAGHDGIVAARQDSPLVIGHGEEEHFIASDVTAFVEHTRQVTYLEDGDIAHLTDAGVTVTNQGHSVERPIEEIDWDPEAAEKGGYDHYMLKEIHEQPHALRQALSGRLDELEGTVDLELGLADEYLQSIDEIQLVAAGTSYHAGLFASHLLETYADVSTSTHFASEYSFGGGRDPVKTLVLAITQSGETADTLSAIRRATKAGARTLALTNTVGSTVTRETDESVFIRAARALRFSSNRSTISFLRRHQSDGE